MGALSRRKGKTFELLVVHAFRTLYPMAKRGCAQYRNARLEEDKKADVELTPWWIECSHGSRVNITAKMNQALQSTDGRLPIVVTRCNNQHVLATMLLTDFITLLRDERVSTLLHRRHPELYAELRSATEKGDQ